MKCWTWSDVKTYFWEVAFRSRILYFVSTRAVNICIFKVTFNWYKIRFESAFKLNRTVSVHCWTLPALKFWNFHNDHSYEFFKPPHHATFLWKDPFIYLELSQLWKIQKIEKYNTFFRALFAIFRIGKTQISFFLCQKFRNKIWVPP